MTWEPNSVKEYTGEIPRNQKLHLNERKRKSNMNKHCNLDYEDQSRNYRFSWHSSPFGFFLSLFLGFVFFVVGLEFNDKC